MYSSSLCATSSWLSAQSARAQPNHFRAPQGWQHFDGYDWRPKQRSNARYFAMIVEKQKVDVATYDDDGKVVHNQVHETHCVF